MMRATQKLPSRRSARTKKESIMPASQPRRHAKTTKQTEHSIAKNKIIPACLLHDPLDPGRETTTKEIVFTHGLQCQENKDPARATSSFATRPACTLPWFGPGPLACRQPQQL